jgi:hypothetical protein
MVAPRRSRGRLGAIAGGAALVVAAACEGGLPEPVTPESYRAALTEVCVAAAAELDGLPDPPEQISVPDFATQAAEVLTREATRADRLDLPRDDTLRADHRAFVRATEDQADAWREVATAAGSGGDVGPAADRIRQLVLGRNDLADTMQVAACRRDP